MKKSSFPINNTSEPLKWKKHIVLVHWGLRDEENLIKSINRYSIENISGCVKDIKNEFKQNVIDFSIIIKLVYQYNYLSLPNIIIKSEKDIKHLDQAIKRYNLSDFCEIWYCKNRTHNNGMVFGRMSFRNDDLFPAICKFHYDLVWSSSARTIENYPYIDCPFMQIDKENWNAEPVFKYITKDYMQEEAMQAVASKILLHISSYSSRIKDFATFAFSAGCKQLCLEFSYVDDSFNFIDWDSDNDRIILSI